MQYALRKRVLVTGGTRFLGSHLCQRLLDGGHDVLCIDNFIAGTRDNVLTLFDNPRMKSLTIQRVRKRGNAGGIEK